MIFYNSLQVSSNTAIITGSQPFLIALRSSLITLRYFPLYFYHSKNHKMMGFFLGKKEMCFFFSGIKNHLHFSLLTHSIDISYSGEFTFICFLTKVTFPSLLSPQSSYFVPEGQVLGLILFFLVAYLKKRFQQVRRASNNRMRIICFHLV